MKAKRVLLGTAGTGTSWGILNSLKETFPESFVVATDMAPAHLIAASSRADEFAQVPPIVSSDFESTVLGLLAEHEIDTYVPTHDPEVILAAELREAGKLDGIACPAPPSWSSRLCWDKEALAGWLAERGYPTPPTLPASALTDVGSGWIVKPRQGVGSVGVRRIESQTDLDHLGSLDLDEAIAQPLLPGPELTVDGFVGSHGLLSAICRERIEVKSGVCTKARVFHDTALESLTLDVARALEFRGAYCIQLMGDGAGDWQITDINPRPGAGTRLSVALGFNVHAATFADLWGRDPRPYLTRIDGEHFAVRQYSEIVLV